MAFRGFEEGVATTVFLGFEDGVATTVFMGFIGDDGPTPDTLRGAIGLVRPLVTFLGLRTLRRPLKICASGDSRGWLPLSLAVPVLTLSLLSLPSSSDAPLLMSSMSRTGLTTFPPRLKVFGAAE